MELFDLNLLFLMDSYGLIFLTTLCMYFIIKEFSLRFSFVKKSHVLMPNKQIKSTHLFLFSLYRRFRKQIALVRRKVEQPDDKEDEHVFPYLTFLF